MNFFSFFFFWYMHVLEYLVNKAIKLLRSENKPKKKKTTTVGQ